MLKMVQQLRLQAEEMRVELAKIVKDNVSQLLKIGYQNELSRHNRIRLSDMLSLNDEKEENIFILKGRLYNQVNITAGPVTESEAFKLADNISYGKGSIDSLLHLAEELEYVINNSGNQ